MNLKVIKCLSSTVIIGLVLMGSLVNCKGQSKNRESHEKSISKISHMIDSLLLGKISSDNQSLNYYLKNNRDSVIYILIDKIDCNKEIYLIDPTKKVDYRVSTIPKIKSFVGVKAMCLLNELINDDKMLLIKSESNLQSICVSGLLLKNGENLELNDLKRYKSVYLNWFNESSNLDLSIQKEKWNTTFKHMISKELE